MRIRKWDEKVARTILTRKCFQKVDGLATFMTKDGEKSEKNHMGIIQLSLSISSACQFP
jgi:hypothetical protein